jgi:formamidopyrimidine-DNA glycosylase
VPEILEVEMYRALAERRALGRRIAVVHVDDPWYLKNEGESLVGRSFVRARRHGKLLLLDLDDERVLGLRFGMTGTLRVDGAEPIGRLLYSPAAAGYDRWGVDFDDGGQLRISDPRRLGGVMFDPDEARLGPDALTITVDELAAALRGSAPLKARLLDQSRVAGIGNLLADEVLWRAGLSPGRPSGSLRAEEVAHLHAELGSTLVELGERGGSHLGDLMAERHPGGHCPKDGSDLRVTTVGGRTSWWCDAHQR